jgi:hypothetical protein
MYMVTMAMAKTTSSTANVDEEDVSIFGLAPVLLSTVFSLEAFALGWFAVDSLKKKRT